MGMFGQMGDMYRLQREVKKIKKELAGIHVFAESEGVKVTVNGEQEIVKVEILEESALSDRSKIERSILDATNRAMKKAQKIAAERMKAVMGDMPGMGG